MARELIRNKVRQGRPRNLPEIAIVIDELSRWSVEVTRALNNLVSVIPDDSTASDVAGVVADLNSLLGELRTLSTR